MPVADIIAVAFSGLTFFVLTSWLAKPAWKVAPRDRLDFAKALRRTPWWYKICLVFGLFGMSVTVIPTVVHGNPFWLVYLGVCALPTLWLWLFGDATFRGTDAALNYRFEPNRCGSCGYELHPDVEGRKPARCSECDWPVPAEAPRVEPPDWWVLRRYGGRVDYLYDPAFTVRQSLRAAGFLTFFSAAVAGVSALPHAPPGIVVGAGIGLAGVARQLLNARRAAAYGRRLAAAGGGGFNAARE